MAIFIQVNLNYCSIAKGPTFSAEWFDSFNLNLPIGNTL